MSKAHPFVRTCRICGKEFESQQPQAIYCSDECREEAARRRMKSQRSEKKLKEKICPICGKKFMTPANNRKYCSDECSKEANRRNMKEYEKGRRGELHTAKKETYTRTPEEEARLNRKSAEGYGKQQMKETLAMVGHVQLPEGA